MKQKVIFITLLSFMITCFSVSVIAADFTFWRVASTLEEQQNGKRFLHEMWVGTATSPLICGSQPAPCSLGFHADAVDDVSLQGDFKAVMTVLTPDPLLPAGFMPSKVVAEYAVTGNLDVIAGTVNGEIKFGPSVKKTFSGTFGADLLSISAFGETTPLTAGVVVRVDANINP